MRIWRFRPEVLRAKVSRPRERCCST
jgi:hypothetical protein